MILFFLENENRIDDNGRGDKNKKYFYRNDEFGGIIISQNEDILSGNDKYYFILPDNTFQLSVDFLFAVFLKIKITVSLVLIINKTAFVLAEFRKKMTNSFFNRT